MGLTGLEPVTFRLSAECSNQLSYKPRPTGKEATEVARVPLLDSVFIVLQMLCLPYS